MQHVSAWTPVTFAALLVSGLANAQTTYRVSEASGGSQVNAASGGGSVSADGRFVAFYSDAPDFDPTDSGNSRDVFVRDSQTGLVDRVSVVFHSGVFHSGGSEPTISSDGGAIAYWSSTNLVAGDTNGTNDVYVSNRVTGTVERVSVSSGGAQGDGPSAGPRISADARWVVFSSRATNLVAGDTNGYQDVFVHDRQTGTTERVSVDSTGAESNYDSYQCSISDDGRFVAFQSFASNLVAADTNAATDIFVHDRQAGTTERVSLDAAGLQLVGSSDKFSFSGNGRFIAFQNHEPNVVPGDTNVFADVFLRDRIGGTTELVSGAYWGGPADHHSHESSISPDGRFVVFHSWATDLIEGDHNNQGDAFLRDRVLGTTEIVSLRANGAQANSFSWPSSISPDGRFVTFYSFATNIVPGDTNAVADVYLRDRGVLPVSFCSGDGTAAACPCGSGNAAAGCPSSIHPGGATLRADGTTSLTMDGLVLWGASMPNSSALYIQGTLQLSGGAGVVFGDGLRCVGGTVLRLGTQMNVGGASQYPALGDPSVSVRGQVTTPGTRTYQIWYRNAAVHCTPATFNLTNGMEVVWAL